jgi:small redox-active disulfide protein 2
VRGFVWRAQWRSRSCAATNGAERQIVEALTTEEAMGMKLTVYGIGCPKCMKTEEVAREALKQLSVEAEVEKVKDIGKIAKAGVLMTPALAIDGKVVASGRVPDVAEVVSHIATAMHGS